jgi:hypothetical protein
MSIMRPVRPADKQSAVTADMEGEIQQFVRKASSRDSADKDSTPFGNGVSDNIQRVASTSVTEIDRLISELTQLRSRLQSEGKRVQSEIARVQSNIADYTQTSEAAMQSIKAIDQSLGHFRRAAAASQID